MYSYQQWIEDFLTALGAPLSQNNIDFMQAWIAKESGSYPITYGFNPLNTTQTAPGSYGGGSQGNIQFFNSYASGLQATIQTIKNGYYPDILGALLGGTANTNTYYPGLNTWGTHQLSGVSPNQASMTTQGNAPVQQTGYFSQGLQSAIMGPFSLLSAKWDQLASNVLVSGFAVILILIGALWIIFGNEGTRKVFLAKASDALV